MNNIVKKFEDDIQDNINDDTKDSIKINKASNIILVKFMTTKETSI